MLDKRCKQNGQDDLAETFGTHQRRFCTIFKTGVCSNKPSQLSQNKYVAYASSHQATVLWRDCEDTMQLNVDNYAATRNVIMA